LNIKKEKKMKFVSTRDLRIKPGDVWKMTKQEKDVVLTSNGRPVAILTGVNEETFEAELEVIRRARALLALESIQKDSEMKGTHEIGGEEIQLEIDEVRKGKTF